MLIGFNILNLARNGILIMLFNMD